MRILFTDGIGAAVLHNAKPSPGNRATGFKPNPMPVGDKANRQSDGALTRFRYRDDFGCTFDLTQIPVSSQYVNLLDPSGDITGTVGGTPTGIGRDAVNNGPIPTVQIGRIGVPGDYGFNGLIAKHTISSGPSNWNDMNATAVIGHVYQFIVWVYLASSSTATGAFIDMESGASGTTTANIDTTKKDQWQQLVVTATATATTIEGVLRINGPSGGVLYSDLWQINDLTAGTSVRPVDLADRLAYWLENGGTCEVDMGDLDNNIYTTCGLYPGATQSQPVLSDKANLEYTLSLNLVNLAGSPARMRCHYNA